MALKRKVFAPIKFVCSFDPAIDKTASNYQEYVKSYYDMQHLATVNGDAFTVFTVQPLTRRQKNLIDRFEGQQKAAAVVQCGLVNVANYIVQSDSGQNKELRTPERKQVGEMGYMVTDDWMDEANFLQEELNEIADAISTISEARPLS